MIGAFRLNSENSKIFFLSKIDWKFYFQEKILTIFFLGFSAGLPFPLVYSTLTGWLEESDIERSTISTFAWLGFAYSFKFIWSPLVDSLKVPFLGGYLGRRRSWLAQKNLSRKLHSKQFHQIFIVNNLAIF